MKKRIIAAMLSITLALGMTACGAGKQDAASAAPKASVPSNSVPEASAPSDPAPGASAPSDPASEASTPESQASEGQPHGWGLPAAVEALLEKWMVKDDFYTLSDLSLRFVGGIKDGQEYQGCYGELGDYSGDEIGREIWDTFGTVSYMTINSDGGTVNVTRTGAGGGDDWLSLTGTYNTHPENDKFLELLLQDAAGNMISYTAVAAAPPDEDWRDVLILFRTDGGDGNIQFFESIY